LTHKTIAVDIRECGSVDSFRFEFHQPRNHLKNK